MDDSVGTLLGHYDVAVADASGAPRQRILRWAAELQDALVAAAAVKEPVVYHASKPR